MNCSEGGGGRSGTARSRVVLRGTASRPVVDALRECMERCQWRDLVGRDAKVVLKPNLCTSVPEKVCMSNTALEVTAAVCQTLAERTRHIAIGESDGLRDSADSAFRVSGYQELVRLYGVELVNFTKEPWSSVPCGPAGKVALPRRLLEADVFVTLPKLKTHALTYFTGALKNQWGCLPQHDRILFHRWLDPMLVELHRRLRPALAIMDAIVCTEGRGPTNGKPRRLDLILASRDSVAVDAAAMRLVGLDPLRAHHVRLAAESDLGRLEAHEIELDGEWQRCATEFEPAVRDGAIRTMNFMTRYHWFVKYALKKDCVFYPARAAVQLLRKVGLVEGG